MIEVHPGLFVGSEADELGTRGASEWFVGHACKEPFHRAALGYEGRGAPSDDPEYLVAHRPGCVILNLIDAPDPQFIRAEVVAAAIKAIADNLTRSKVLVHCNKGESRAPTIALLYLALHTDRFDDCDYAAAAARFSESYPAYRPAAGMAGFARAVWAGEVELAEPEVIRPTEKIVTPRDTPRSPCRAVFRL